MQRALVFLLSLAFVGFSSPLSAQDNSVPYWASINAEVVNMRVGPSTSYRIAWVYKRDGLPLRVLRKKEGWRLVEDPDGDRGWVLGRFLSRERTAIVVGDGHAEMRDEVGEGRRLLWRLAPGVTGKLGDCEANWCELDAAGHKGLVRQDRLWGVGGP